MGRPAKPTSIDSAIERLEQKVISAAADSRPTGKASKVVLEIIHHLTALQLVKKLIDSEGVWGQVLSAAQKYLAHNSIKREPGMYGDEDTLGHGGPDGEENYAAYLDKLSAGMDLPYGDSPEIDITKD